MGHVDHAAMLCALRAAVRDGDHHPATRLNLALAEGRAGDPAVSHAMLEELASECPDWAEPPLRLAERHRAAGDRPAAIAAYRQALACAPEHPVALLALGALLASEAPHEACALLRRRCAMPDAPAEALDALGAALLAVGDAPGAVAVLRQASALAPGNRIVALRLAQAGAQAGTEDADAAEPMALLARGAALLGQDQAAGAAMLQAALALAPDDAALAAMVADLLLRTGDNAAAEAALRRAIALAPDQPALRINLAVALTRLHRHAAACAVLEALPAIDDPAALCTLAGALACLARHEAAIAAARRATLRDPRSHLAWRTLANVMAYAESTTGTALLGVLREAGRTAPRRTLPALRARRRSAADRLRVGLVGGTLCTHPAGWLALAGLENLDPEWFSLLCLAQPESADPMQRRFRAIADEWHVAGDQPARQARALRLDLAIDLGGYGLRGMMSHFAERLAPVQMKWIGMQNHSSGLREMDWFITDRWETPPPLAHLYTERLLTMPDGYACYTPPPHAPEVSPPPCLTRGHVTFGCFNNLAKITDALVALWCDILQALPEARLLLKTHQFDEPEVVRETQARFARHGIEAARVELRGASPHRQLLAQYADVDIVLDPHPYSGGLTTCEALWMGVPVLTMPGETFASRHSTSHLCNVGLPDWVCADRAAYRAQAIGRAADRTELEALRRGLRARMRRSPLCDGPRFGRNLATALLRAAG